MKFKIPIFPLNDVCDRPWSTCTVQVDPQVEKFSVELWYLGKFES